MTIQFEPNVAYFAEYIGKGTWFNRIIRWHTKSKVSHCEWVINGIGYSSSIQDNGVRAKAGIDWNNGNWIITKCTKINIDDIKKHYEITKTKQYGFLGLLLTQIFYLFDLDTPGDFCSEWCAESICLPNPRMYNPGSLGDLIRWIHNF